MSVVATIGVIECMWFVPPVRLLLSGFVPDAAVLLMKVRAAAMSIDIVFIMAMCYCA